MAAIFGERKILGKLPRVLCSDTLWVEYYDKIALSRTVKEIEANLCFSIFGKISKKIKMAAIFGKRKFFLKITIIMFLRYPVDRKFRQNHSISHG